MAPRKSAEQFVTAAMVAAKRADGSVVYLYKGTRVPDGLADGEARRLADLGMIGAGPVVPVTAAAPTLTRRAPAAAPKKAAPAAKAKADEPGPADDGRGDEG